MYLVCLLLNYITGEIELNKIKFRTVSKNDYPRYMVIQHFFILHVWILSRSNAKLREIKVPLRINELSYEVRWTTTPSFVGSREQQFRRRATLLHNRVEIQSPFYLRTRVRRYTSRRVGPIRRLVFDIDETLSTERERERTGYKKGIISSTGRACLKSVHDTTGFTRAFHVSPLHAGRA